MDNDDGLKPEWRGIVVKKIVTKIGKREFKEYEILQDGEQFTILNSWENNSLLYALAEALYEKTFKNDALNAENRENPEGKEPGRVMVEDLGEGYYGINVDGHLVFDLKPSEKHDYLYIFAEEIYKKMQEIERNRSECKEALESYQKEYERAENLKEQNAALVETIGTLQSQMNKPLYPTWSNFHEEGLFYCPECQRCWSQDRSGGLLSWQLEEWKESVDSYVICPECDEWLAAKPSAPSIGTVSAPSDHVARKREFRVQSPDGKAEEAARAIVDVENHPTREGFDELREHDIQTISQLPNELWKAEEAARAIMDAENHPTREGFDELREHDKQTIPQLPSELHYSEIPPNFSTMDQFNIRDQIKKAMQKSITMVPGTQAMPFSPGPPPNLPGPPPLPGPAPPPGDWGEHSRSLPNSNEDSSLKIRPNIIVEFLDTNMNDEEDIKKAIEKLNPAEIFFLRFVYANKINKTKKE